VLPHSPPGAALRAGTLRLTARAIGAVLVVTVIVAATGPKALQAGTEGSPTAPVHLQSSGGSRAAVRVAGRAAWQVVQAASCRALSLAGM
jgi:hypothetical protein